MANKKNDSETLRSHSTDIYKYYGKNRRMPSYAEICKICGIKSKNTAHALVRKLASLNLIEIDKSGRLIPKESQLLAQSSRVSNSSKSTQSTKAETPLRLLGLVEAGFPTPSEESLHENISLDDWIIGRKEASFMLKVKGDSMRDAGILDGDMVIVERTENPKVGQIVVADVDGAHTMKYLRKDSRGQFYLEPANSKFDNIYPEENMQISAVVKAVVRKY